MFSEKTHDGDVMDRAYAEVRVGNEDDGRQAGGFVWDDFMVTREKLLLKFADSFEQVGAA